jgi:chromosome segregation ATPase
MSTIARFEGDTKDSNSQSDGYEADIRDLGKKIQGYESGFDETFDKLNKALTALEEKEKAFKTAEEEVSALTRRIMLMEEEAKKADSSMAETVTKLAIASKDADGILKRSSSLRARP